VREEAMLLLMLKVQREKKKLGRGNECLHLLSHVLGTGGMSHLVETSRSEASLV
jgi:hypothetical protein